MEYIEVVIRIDNQPVLREQCIAGLLSLGYDGFMESDDFITAYIPSGSFSDPKLQQYLKKLGHNAAVQDCKPLPDQNWNALWESNYDPVRIGHCLVRAPFHAPVEGIAYDIVIQPKMSFGTAHHATTRLMIEQMLQMDLSDKKVLDLGCGTAVLAILASKMGARQVMAIDNDPWAVENAVENCQRNAVTNVHVVLGEAGSIQGNDYDILLANINRNILLNDLPNYNRALASPAVALLSGFYPEDVRLIAEKAALFGWELAAEKIQEGWEILVFRKH